MNYQQSPELMMEHARLLREVEFATQVMIGLQQQYEIAVVQAKRDTPSIVILDRPQRPLTRPDGPIVSSSSCPSGYSGAESDCWRTSWHTRNVVATSPKVHLTEQ